MDFKIGIIVDSLRLNIEEGIKKAAELGAEGIQLYATRGKMAPENLSAKRRLELLDIIKSNGLQVSAVCGDFGHPGFYDAEQNPVRIERSKLVMDLAKDLGSNIVTTHIGPIPDDMDDPRWKIMQEACERLGEYGDKTGAFFAIETGPESASLLKKFLDSLKSSSVRVNFDPANLAMVIGEKAEKAVKILGPYIVHTHAKDGIMLNKGNREVIYGAIKGEDKGPYFKEVPLGEGAVDFHKYLKALDKYTTSDFNKFLTIEREVGQNPAEDIKNAVLFLKEEIEKCKK